MAKIRPYIHVLFYSIIYIAIIFILSSLYYEGGRWTLLGIPAIMLLEIFILIIFLTNSNQINSEIKLSAIPLYSIVVSGIVSWNVIWFFESFVTLYSSYVMTPLVFFFMLTFVNTFFMSIITIQFFKSSLMKMDSEVEYNEQLKNEAELFKLRQQVNPHFLFNALNSIQALSYLDTNKSNEMIYSLSQYFRNSIQKQDQSIIKLEDEINDIRLYLSIEMIRFGHRLKISEDIDESTLSRFVPPLLLQPLIENAIKYGIYGTEGDVELKIIIKNHETTSKQAFTSCTIINPYDPVIKINSGTGFGLAGIKRRLYLTFNRNDLLNIYYDKKDGDKHFFTAQLLIPNSQINTDD